MSRGGRQRRSSAPSGSARPAVWLTFLASTVALISYLIPIVAVVIGAVAFDEPLRPRLLAGSALVLIWPSGYQLLSATNIPGPYTPISGATSPWTNRFGKPQEFFKLQAL